MAMLKTAYFKWALSVWMVASSMTVHAAQTCDSKCLSSFMDRYLTALATRNPAALPTAPNLKVAENSHSVALGENLWQVIVKIDPAKHYFADPATGQIVALGRLELNAGESFLYTVRLKVEDNLISEIETMVTSDKIAGQHFKPENMAEFDPLYLSIVPDDQRATREELLKIAAAVWQDEGRGATYASDCVHSENADRLQYRCSAIPRGGMFTAQRALRHPIVDVERGVVVTYALQDAVPRPRTPPAGEKTPIFYQRPVTFYVMQLLKVADGQIRGDSLFANIQEANAPAPFAAAAALDNPAAPTSPAAPGARKATAIGGP